MLVFNNQQRSGYEELVSYSPKYYAQIKEMDAIYRFAGWTLDLMAEDLENIISMQFISGMNEDVLTRFENFFGIQYGANITLEERKRLDASVYNSQGKLSATKIRHTIRSIIGNDTEVDVKFLNSSGLFIHVNSFGAEELIKDEINRLFTKMIPTHIPWSIIYQEPMSGIINFGGMLSVADTITIRQVMN